MSHSASNHRTHPASNVLVSLVGSGIRGLVRLGKRSRSDSEEEFSQNRPNLENTEARNAARKKVFVQSTLPFFAASSSRIDLSHSNSKTSSASAAKKRKAAAPPPRKLLTLPALFSQRSSLVSSVALPVSPSSPLVIRSVKSRGSGSGSSKSVLFIPRQQMQRRNETKAKKRIEITVESSDESESERESDSEASEAANKHKNRNQDQNQDQEEAEASDSSASQSSADSDPDFEASDSESSRPRSNRGQRAQQPKRQSKLIAQTKKSTSQHPTRSSQGHPRSRPQPPPSPARSPPTDSYSPTSEAESVSQRRSATRQRRSAADNTDAKPSTAKKSSRSRRAVSLSRSHFSQFTLDYPDDEFHSALGTFRGFRHMTQEEKDETLESEADREAELFKPLKPLWDLVQCELDGLIDSRSIVDPIAFRDLILAFHQCDKGGRLRRICLLEPQFLLFILYSIRRIRHGPNNSPSIQPPQAKFVLPTSPKPLLEQIISDDDDDEDFSPDEEYEDADSGSSQSRSSSALSISRSSDGRSTRSSRSSALQSGTRIKRAGRSTRSIASTKSASDSSRDNSPVKSRSSKSSKLSRDGRPAEFQSTGVSYLLSDSLGSSSESRAWFKSRVQSRDDYHMFLAVLVYMSIISIADDEHIGNLKKTIFFNALIVHCEYGENSNATGRRLRASTAKKSHGNEMMYKFDALTIELVQRDLLPPLPMPTATELDQDIE